MCLQWYSGEGQITWTYPIAFFRIFGVVCGTNESGYAHAYAKTPTITNVSVGCKFEKAYYSDTLSALAIGTA